ncbi:hypothetical protein HDV00_003978 [Rhizophlyctis rosea]|nr:hypothetical protein HDV00_003978 [Rhizophlyctis rosea]
MTNPLSKHPKHRPTLLLLYLTSRDLRATFYLGIALTNLLASLLSFFPFSYTHHKKSVKDHITHAKTHFRGIKHLLCALWFGIVSTTSLHDALFNISPLPLPEYRRASLVVPSDTVPTTTEEERDLPHPHSILKRPGSRRGSTAASQPHPAGWQYIMKRLTPRLWQTGTSDSSGFFGTWWQGFGNGEWFAFVGHNQKDPRTLLPLHFLPLASQTSHALHPDIPTPYIHQSIAAAAEQLAAEKLNEYHLHPEGGILHSHHNHHTNPVAFAHEVMSDHHHLRGPVVMGERRHSLTQQEQEAAAGVVKGAGVASPFAEGY